MTTPLRARGRRTCTGLLLGVLLAGTAAAQVDLRPTEKRASRSEIELSLRRLGNIDEVLQKRDWKKARRLSDRAIEILEQSLVTRGSDLIGISLAQRAVAFAGLGEDREAQWDAFAADAFSAHARPKLREFGDLGNALADILDQDEKPAVHTRVGDSGLGILTFPAGNGADERAEDVEGSAVVPPRAIEQRRPEYPAGAASFGIETLVLLEVVIDDHGIPRYPRLLKGGAYPALSLSALETMRKWRFRPARLGDQPVATYYTLSVNYRRY